MIGLVGDIGGTNARFGLVELGSVTNAAGSSIGEAADGAAVHAVDFRVSAIQVLKVAGFSNLQEALQHYLSENGNPAVSSSVIAVATPVLQDFLEMTNSHWAFSQAAVARQFGFHKLSFVNDFTALAYSLPWLTPQQLSEIGTTSKQLPVAEHRVKAVLGPGTGLGVSAVIPHGDSWVALQGEGGHTTLFAGNERENAIFDCMRHLLKDEEHNLHLSYERLLSGSGLSFTHRALLLTDGISDKPKSAPDILQEGLSGDDPTCQEVLEIFCRQLGQRSADLAVTVGATGGVYLGGGILPRMQDFFVASGFRSTFENKGRMTPYLQAIPTRLILEPYAALTGAAYLLSEMAV